MQRLTCRPRLADHPAARRRPHRVRPAARRRRQRRPLDHDRPSSRALRERRRCALRPPDDHARAARRRRSCREATLRRRRRHAARRLRAPRPGLSIRGWRWPTPPPDAWSLRPPAASYHQPPEPDDLSAVFGIPALELRPRMHVCVGGEARRARSASSRRLLPVSRRSGHAQRRADAAAGHGARAGRIGRSLRRAAARCATRWCAASSAGSAIRSAAASAAIIRRPRACSTTIRRTCSASPATSARLVVGARFRYDDGLSAHARRRQLLRRPTALSADLRRAEQRPHPRLRAARRAGRRALSWPRAAHLFLDVQNVTNRATPRRSSTRRLHSSACLHRSAALVESARRARCHGGALALRRRGGAAAAAGLRHAGVAGDRAASSRCAPSRPRCARPSTRPSPRSSSRPTAPTRRPASDWSLCVTPKPLAKTTSSPRLSDAWCRPRRPRRRRPVDDAGQRLRAVRADPPPQKGACRRCVRATRRHRRLLPAGERRRRRRVPFALERVTCDLAEGGRGSRECRTR